MHICGWQHIVSLFKTAFSSPFSVFYSTLHVHFLSFLVTFKFQSKKTKSPSIFPQERIMNSDSIHWVEPEKDLSPCDRFNALMGGSGSKLEKALGDNFPEGEHYFGLENFGNTCYCNSVLQVFVNLISVSSGCRFWSGYLENCHLIVALSLSLIVLILWMQTR